MDCTERVILTDRETATDSACAVVMVAGDGVTVKPAQTVNLSWSADHRVVDGATMARMAQVVQKYLEEPGTMIVDMS